MMLTKSLQEIRSLRTTRFTRLLYRSSSKEWDNHDREDIEDALKHPEPSAIKGAFSIVVDNEMMQTNCEYRLHTL